MPKARKAAVSEGKPAFLFDLDGTLIDSVYQHVLTWREALHEMDIELSTWRIHRRVGMSDGLILTALQRETGRKLSKKEADRLKDLHNQAFHKRISQVRPLPGAKWRREKRGESSEDARCRFEAPVDHSRRRLSWQTFS
jgi:beta-phosphoglucomutase-like phosphatase (HAD superfamily)